MQPKNLMIWTLAILAISPVAALAAPTISVTRNFDSAVTGPVGRTNNYLDANGNWVWVVQIANSNPIPTGSSPLAAELGFTASGVPTNETAALKGATNLSTGTNDDFYVLEPGTPIFGWEQLTDVGGQMKAIGLQSNCAAGCTTTGNANQVFSALSSVNYNTVGPHDYVQIVTRGPSVGGGTDSLSSTLTVSGAYGGKGRVSERDSSGTMVNYDTFSNVFTRTTIPGDANMDGYPNDGDWGIVQTNLNFGTNTNKKWFDGNFTNHLDGAVNDGDVNIMLTNLNIGSTTIGSGGAPIVAMTENNNVVRTQAQGAGTYKVIDLYMTMTAGAEYTNHRVIATAASGSLFDPARLQDDRQQDDAAGESNTAGSVDTYANTVMSAASKESGFSATIRPNSGSYIPAGTSPAMPFTFLDWSVYSTNTADDNDLSDYPAGDGGPFAKTAPYRIARILASNNGTGTIQVQAFDTLSGGVPTIYNFTYGNPDDAGDFNHDGVVNSADYITWRSTGGTPAAYNAWRANFGKVLFGAGSGTTYSAVPEPSTALMLLSLAAGAMCRRKLVRQDHP